ncbi:MAG: YhfC family intramembrane metalloprotease [Nanoarchaeota archaeon]|nr:YhfC family intramembrane metalloprotease [Nanoarchaeota archaeon]
MLYLIEIGIALIITFYFIKRENPKIKFLYLGYIFFILAMILQLPFRYLELELSQTIAENLGPTIILSVLTIIVSELTKYFSLKKFLKTKSYKNGILFGIGWSSIESINFFTANFYYYIFTILNFELHISPFLGENLSIISFIFLFVFNLSLTVLIIIAIIKKKIIYVVYSIWLSLIMIYLPIFFNGYVKTGIYITLFLYAIYLIFKYRNIK